MSRKEVNIKQIGAVSFNSPRARKRFSDYQERLKRLESELPPENAEIEEIQRATGKLEEAKRKFENF